MFVIRHDANDMHGHPSTAKGIVHIEMVRFTDLRLNLALSLDNLQEAVGIKSKCFIGELRGYLLLFARWALPDGHVPELIVVIIW